MKPILLSIVLFLYCSSLIYAQSKPDPGSNLVELKLSPEQKLAIKAAILEYRQNDRMRKQQLRAKLLQILNRRQQAMVMHWRRIQR